jgi:TATA-box binding protein (TBP) (component of TFIID and TFIIIB)
MLIRGQSGRVGRKDNDEHRHGKRKRPRLHASHSLDGMPRPKFLIRSNRKLPTRPSNPPPAKRPRTTTARERLQQEFRRNTPTFVLDRHKTDQINDDLFRITEDIMTRKRELQQLQQEQQMSVSDFPDPAVVAPTPTPTSPTPVPEAKNDDTDGDHDGDGDNVENLLEVLYQQPNTSFADTLAAPIQIPADPIPRKMPNPWDPAEWLAVCQELDEMRGRTPPQDTSIRSSKRMQSVMQLVTRTAATDPRGPDPKDFENSIRSNSARNTTNVGSTGRGDAPPLDQVVCRVQNWVVTLDCVLDRYSVRRAVEQARKDLLWRRQLLRAAVVADADDPRSVFDTPTTHDYDRWWVESLQAKWALGTNALHGFESDLPKDGATSPRMFRENVPMWDRSVPRVHDLVRCIEALETNAKKFRRDRPKDDWCDGVDLRHQQHRPALNLHELAYRMLPYGARYDMYNFPALTISTANPKAACLLYSSLRAQAGSDVSARVVCTGAKTPEEVAWTIKKLEHALIKADSLPICIDRASFVTPNIVASALLPFYVDMEKLSRQCGVFCSYTPLVFPGATLRLPPLDEKTAILVFPTKIVITGAKAKRSLQQALRIGVQVTWRARHVDMNTQAARTMVEASERVLVELLQDVENMHKQPKQSPWATAIRQASAVHKKRT